MTITTKYSMGDTAWLMQNNRPVSITIYAIAPGAHTVDNYYSNYYFSSCDQFVCEHGKPNGGHAEYLLFSTKEALLAAL